jgi:hypothetical protein
MARQRLTLQEARGGSAPDLAQGRRRRRRRWTALLNRDGDVDAAHRLLAGAIENYPSEHDPSNETVTEALNTLLMVCLFGGRPELWEPFHAAVARLSACRNALLRVVHDGRAGGAVVSAIQALILLSYDNIQSGDWGAADTLAEEALQLCEARGYQLFASPVGRARPGGL